MEHKVLQTIKKYNMLCPNEKIVVALSGGADSVALFHFLYSNKNQLQIELFAAHLNHGLRGEESDADEQFVVDLCKKYKVQLFCLRENMAHKQAPKGMGTEEWARILRYNFLQNCAEANDAKIATAHTLSDNCETLVFHLARGTGAKGASGIAPVRQNIIRPFIEITRAEIEKYCQKNDLLFVTDSTNLTDDYTRNNIRHNILPRLADINVQYQAAMGRFLNTQREMDSYFSQKVEKIVEKTLLPTGEYDRTVLEKLQEIELKYFILNITKDFVQIDNKRLELCLQLFNKANGAVQVSTDKILAINNKGLYWRKENLEIDYEMPLEEGDISLFGGINVRCEVASCKENMNFINLSKKALKSYADYDKIQDNMILRTRKDGDVFSPAGRGCTKTLKKFFNESKLPAYLRGILPVLADGNKIVWIMGFGFAQGFTPDQNTKNILVLEGTMQEDRENSDV